MANKMMQLCKQCENSEPDHKGLACKLTGRNCRFYPTDGDCVNFIEKSEESLEILFDKV